MAEKLVWPSCGSSAVNFWERARVYPVVRYSSALSTSSWLGAAIRNPLS